MLILIANIAIVSLILNDYKTIVNILFVIIYTFAIITIRIINKNLFSLFRRKKISFNIIILVFRIILFKINKYYFLIIEFSNYVRITFNFVIQFKTYRLKRRKKFINLKKF